MVQKCVGFFFAFFRKYLEKERSFFEPLLLRNHTPTRLPLSSEEGRSILVVLVISFQKISFLYFQVQQLAQSC